MTVVDDQEEDERKRRHKPVLQLFKGGRSDDEDWLSSLPVGTVFSWKDKGTFLVHKSEVLSRSRTGLIKLLFNYYLTIIK